MDYILVPQAIVLFITAVISAVVAYIAWQRRASAGGRLLSWAMLAIFVWTFGTALENAAVDLSAKILWSQIEYIGLVNVSPLFLLFILDYCGLKRPSRRMLIALWVIPVITLLMAWTNAWHGLLWSGFSPGSRVANTMIFQHGVWFWVSTAYYYTMFAAMNVILVRQFLRASQPYRRQLGAIILASFFPALSGVMYIADLNLVPGLDWTPLGSTALGLVFLWGVSKLQMLDLAPMARDKLIESLADGLIVLDAQERIVDINPAACSILLSGHQAKTEPLAPKVGKGRDHFIGRLAAEALGAWPALMQQLAAIKEASSEIDLSKGAMRRVYELHVLPLTDQRGQIGGRLATLHDITRRKKIEEAEVEQRILAEALGDTAAALNSTLNFDEVLDRILDNMGKVVAHDAAAVALVDDEGVARFVRTAGFAERGLEPVMLNLRLQVAKTEAFQKMARDGSPVIIPDTQKNKEWVQVEGMEWERSYAGAPIRAHGKVTGVIYLYGTTPGFFKADHAKRLQAFADQAAIAIENSRLYTETQRYLKETEALQAAGLAVTSTLDFNLVLDKILDQLGQVLSFDTASVQLLEGERSVIVSARGFENPEEVIGMHYSARDNSLIKKTLTLGRPLTIADVREEYPSFFQGPDRHTRAWLGVPLIAQELPIGFMTLDSKEAGHFTPRDERLAAAFAAQVGIALQNSRLYMEAQRRIEEQSALNEIAQSISSKLEQNALLDVVYEQIKRFIDVQFFVTVAYDSEKDEWKGIYWKDTIGTYDGRPRKSGEGLTGFILKNRNPLLLQTSEELDAFLEVTGYENVGSRPRSFMGVPLVISNRVIGAMVTENFDHDYHYSQQDLSLFLTLASQVAAALENARLYEQMKDLAITDSLTGLYNRRHFYSLASNEVERAVRYKKPLAVLMIDLDHFKRVNDQYGHAVGDQVLQTVARQCQAALRKIDIMGRYGGEEFVIVLPETGFREALRAANRLCELIAAAEIFHALGPVKITASLGLAALNKNHAALEDLLDCADKALYEAKKAGRNQVKIYADQVLPVPPTGSG